MDELLLKAALEGDFPAVSAALQQGASKDATTEFGFTALHVAPTAGHLVIVRLLIDAGADVDRRDRYGVSPLLQAVGWPEIMEALLNAGAKVAAEVAREKGEDEIASFLDGLTDKRGGGV
jgi:ankyrin repeat protein